MKPQRIQRKRTKGWKMPPNTVYVGRPTKWGNPFSASEYGHRLATANYKRRLQGLIQIGAIDLSPLKGKNLACWCVVDNEWCPSDEQWCHADVLLEIANKD
jgi:hypothetical protein